MLYKCRIDIQTTDWDNIDPWQHKELYLYTIQPNEYFLLLKRQFVYHLKLYNLRVLTKHGQIVNFLVLPDSESFFIERIVC